MGDDPNQQGNSRRWIVREVEASLRRLQTDYIDFYLIHRPSSDTDIEETLSALTDLMRSGMGVMVWSPLAKGMLTGRYRKGQPLPDSLRVKVFAKQMSDESRLDAVEQLILVANEAGMPLTHLAMAFTVAHPGVTSAILGPRTMEQFDDLLAGAEVVLSDEVLDRIDQIVPPGTDIGTDAANYVPPAIAQAALRRRPLGERAAG